MVECTFEDALTTAEKACRAALERIMDGRLRVYRFDNPGEADCAVFDIGYSYTGDLNCCAADSYHWRGTLDLYRRDHDELDLIGECPP